MTRPRPAVHVGRCRGIGVVTVAGDLTEGSAAMLRTELVDAMGSVGPRLVLDLRAVQSCVPGAVEAIEGAAHRAWRRGGWVRLAAVPPVVLMAFALDGRCPLTYADVDEAIATRVETGPRP
jgi:anti-sigma B factor antagonist